MEQASNQSNPGCDNWHQFLLHQERSLAPVFWYSGCHHRDVYDSHQALQYGNVTFIEPYIKHKYIWTSAVNIAHNGTRLLSLVEVCLIWMWFITLFCLTIFTLYTQIRSQKFTHVHTKFPWGLAQYTHWWTPYEHHHHSPQPISDPTYEFHKPILPIATKLPLRPWCRVKHQNTTLTLHTTGDASTVQALWTCWMSTWIATTALLHLPAK